MSLTPRIDRIENEIYSDKIDVSKIDVPFTEIVDEQGNPRQITDLANNMKVSMGIERLMFTSIFRLDKEFSSSGQTVFELQNKDPRVRYIGDGWVNAAEDNGTRPYFGTPTATEHKIEITFYGTGLNLLIFNANSERPYNYTIDGGVLETKTFPSQTAFINPKYNMNVVAKIVSGLSLGIHTVVLSPTGTFGWMDIFGCEILNEGSQLAVNPGTPRLQGRELLSQQLIDYNSDFDDTSDVLGTKGGRVLVYQNIDGEIKKRLTATDPAVTLGNPAELINNGTFDVDTTGWVGTNGGVLSVDSQRLKLTNSATLFGGADQTLTGLIIGQSYVLTFDYIKGTASQVHARIYDSTGTVYPYAAGWFSVSGTYQLNFTALETTHHVRLFQVNVSGQTSFFDNVSVKEVAYNHLSLLNSDHSNEEILRTINYREFGANRSNDFSTLGGINDVAFTLDDGTTTLIGDGVSGFSNGVEWGLNPSFVALTFVGTGLDIIARGEFTTLWHTTSITVDGIFVGSISGNSGDSARNIKVVSGLAYGTHTVKFSIGAVNITDMRISDFLIYGPKKPELESTDIELADYNLMADFVGNIDDTIEQALSQGVIRKSNSREIIYGGGGWGQDGAVNLLTSGNVLTGFNTYGINIGSYFEYTFFGTGFEYRTQLNTDRSSDITVSVDGSDLNDGNFPSVTKETYGLITYNSATAQLDTDFASGTIPGFRASGLPLGIHTVRFTNNLSTNANRLFLCALDIITPIHINDTKIGSLGLKDLRNAVDITESVTKNKVDLSKAKVWIKYDMAANLVLSSYNISSVIRRSTGFINVYFKNAFKDENYIVSGLSEGNIGENMYAPQIAYTDVGSVNNKSAASLKMVNSAGATQNRIVTLVFFGELENEEDIDLGDL